MKKKNCKYDVGGSIPMLQGLNSLNPWQQINMNSPEVMQQIYNPMQRIPTIQNSSIPQTYTPQSSTSTVTDGQAPNWNYIFGSQMTQGLLNGFSHLSANSRQNAAQQFNQQHFSPLNYLPRNPNTSEQDLYGMMKDGGEAKPSYLDYYKTIPQEKNNTQNYDLARAYQELPYSTMQQFATNNFAHLPDTYKLPNHPTFSNESVYYDGHTPGQGGYWGEDGNDSFHHNPQVGPPITPTFGNGGKVPPIYVNSKNDPRYKAYQDSLALYNGMSKYNEVHNFLSPKQQAEELQRAVEEQAKNRTPYGFTTNKGNLIYSGKDAVRSTTIAPYAIGDGDMSDKRNWNNGYVELYKQPVQPILVGRPNEHLQNLPLVGNTTPSGSYSPQAMGLSSAAGYVQKNPIGDPVYSIGGAGSPLLGFYNSDGTFRPSQENPDAQQYLNDKDYMQNLIKRNYGTDYKEEEFKKGGGFHLNPAHKGWCTPMTKSTCTGKRRQFALNAKNHFNKKEEGGIIGQEGNSFTNIPQVNPAIEEGYFPQNDSPKTTQQNIGTFQYQHALQYADSLLNTSQAWQIPWNIQQLQKTGQDSPELNAYKAAILKRVANRKMENGGTFEDDWDFLFGEDAKPTQKAEEALDTGKSKMQLRREKYTQQDQQDQQDQGKQFDFLNNILRSNSEAVPMNPTYNINGEQAEMASSIKDRLMDNGLPEHVANGFVGNFVAESSLNPGINNAIGAFGLGQWTGARKDALEKFANKQGKSVDDPLVQADFVTYELDHGEKAAKSKILNSKNSQEAAINIMNHYERPSESEKSGSVSKRVQAAQSAIKFKEGGEYDIDPKEVERLRKLGYSIEIL